MPLYINSYEHYSEAFDSVPEFASGFNNKPGPCLINEGCALNQPVDLYDYIEKRGSKAKDLFTKTTGYIAKKLNRFETESSRLGIIFATEFGNIINMCAMSNLAKDSSQPMSAQIFPNATISSATVTAAIYTNAQGLNITINSGITGFYQAIMIGCNYINENKLDACIVLTGDDYNKFSIEDILRSGITDKYFLSSVNGIIISKNKINDSSNYFIKDVRINSSIPKDTDFLFGYRFNQNELKNIENPRYYIGPSIGFLSLLRCFAKLHKNTESTKCKAAIIDGNSNAVITIGRDNYDF